MGEVITTAITERTVANWPFMPAGLGCYQGIAGSSCLYGRVGITHYIDLSDYSPASLETLAIVLSWGLLWGE